MQALAQGDIIGPFPWGERTEGGIRVQYGVKVMFDLFPDLGEVGGNDSQALVRMRLEMSSGPACGAGHLLTSV